MSLGVAVGHAVSCERGGPVHTELALEQVVSPDERERGPSGDQPTDHFRIGDRDVGGEAGQTPNSEKRPRQALTAPAHLADQQDRHRCRNDHAIQLNGISVALHLPRHIGAQAHACNRS